MARSAKQNEAMRAAARQALIKSAMTLFAHKGYAETSTRQISKDAEISAGLLYHYFPSKESLLLAVFDQSMGRLDGAFTEVLEKNLPANRLAPLLDVSFQILAEDPHYWSLFFSLRAQPAVMKILAAEFRWRMNSLRAVFAQELALIGRAEPELEAYLLYGGLEGTMQQYLLDPESYPLAAVAQRLIRDFTT